MIKFTFERDGSLLAELAKRGADPRPVLKAWGAYLRAGGKAMVEKGAFAPWAASTVAKYAATGTASVTAQGKVRSSYAAKLDTTLKRRGNTDARAALASLVAGDRTTKTDNRAVNRLRRRLEKADKAIESGKAVNIGKRKTERHTMLGKLRQAFRSAVVGNGVTVTNMVGYSKVHNEGGSVGNGATVPERRFLSISQAASSELADMVLNYLLRGKA